MNANTTEPAIEAASDAVGYASDAVGYASDAEDEELPAEPGYRDRAIITGKLFLQRDTRETVLWGFYNYASKRVYAVVSWFLRLIL